MVVVHFRGGVITYLNLTVYSVCPKVDQRNVFCIKELDLAPKPLVAMATNNKQMNNYYMYLKPNRTCLCVTVCCRYQFNGHTSVVLKPTVSSDHIKGYQFFTARSFTVCGCLHWDCVWQAAVGSLHCLMLSCLGLETISTKASLNMFIDWFPPR